MINENINREFKKQNFQYSTIKIKHIPKLISNINSKIASKEISPALYSHYLKDFDTSFPESFPSSSSVLIVAAPQYQIDVRFNWKGQIFSLPVPPTYNHKIDSNVELILDKHLIKNGFIYKKANLPLKLLATSSGLAQYGRSNISFIEGLGSYYRLSAYYTDYSLFQDNWGEPTALKLCETCRICQKKCPTNAINNDSFLIKANHCLTFLNELKEDFPAWLNSNSHNSIIGCMLCQKHCPLNKSFNEKIDFMCEFNGEETYEIINNPKKDFSKETMTKLKGICMDDELEIISRNIKFGLSNLIKLRNKTI
jgi:epoxyqueuosine reductase